MSLSSSSRPPERFSTVAMPSQSCLVGVSSISSTTTYWILFPVRRSSTNHYLVFLFLSAPDDQLSFCSAFQHSIATNLELLSYLRFKSNSPSADELSGFKELLFELKGYPHFVNDECKCFFAMAKPYPSRNTSMYAS